MSHPEAASAAEGPQQRPDGDAVCSFSATDRDQKTIDGCDGVRGRGVLRLRPPAADSAQDDTAGTTPLEF